MVRSHYIPQFILRNFCEEGKITYCDLDAKDTSLRNPRSVFSEVGYYPDTIEKNLSVKAEHLFANLYHNKLENARNSVVLLPDELFALKKYLIVSSIRYDYEVTDEDEKYYDQLPDNFRPEFIGSLNYVLGCESANDMVEYLRKMVPSDPSDILGFLDKDDVNIPLWNEIKDILQSYVVFVKAPKEEEFLIPDTGKGVYMGPMSKKKMYGLLEVVMKQFDPYVFEICKTLTPHDYTVFPLSKRLAVLTMSGFFKLLTDSEVTRNVILPEECPTVSAVLGFGNRDVIKPPKVKMRGGKEYHYDIRQVTATDVSHLNSLMIAQAGHHIAYSSRAHLNKTMKAVGGYTDRDVTFMSCV